MELAVYVATHRHWTSHFLDVWLLGQDLLCLKKKKKKKKKQLKSQKHTEDFENSNKSQFFTVYKLCATLPCCVQWNSGKHMTFICNYTLWMLQFSMSFFVRPLFFPEFPFNQVHIKDAAQRLQWQYPCHNLPKEISHAGCACSFPVSLLCSAWMDSSGWTVTICEIN